MNPLFNMFNGGGNNIFQNTPFGNMMNFMQSFNQFRQGFQGDPKQQVKNLLNSGQMTPDQLNQLQQMAQQIRGMMK